MTPLSKLQNQAQGAKSIDDLVTLHENAVTLASQRPGGLTSFPLRSRALGLYLDIGENPVGFANLKASLWPLDNAGEVTAIHLPPSQSGTQSRNVLRWGLFGEHLQKTSLIHALKTKIPSHVIDAAGKNIGFMATRDIWRDFSALVLWLASKQSGQEILSTFKGAESATIFLATPEEMTDYKTQAGAIKTYFKPYPKGKDLPELALRVANQSRKATEVFGFVDATRPWDFTHDGNTTAELWDRIDILFDRNDLNFMSADEHQKSLNQNESLGLLSRRYREEDCPTTPDGAWLRYLDELVKPAAISVMLPEPTEGGEAEAPTPEPLALPETKPNAPAPTKGKVRKAKVTGKPVWEGVDPDDIWLRVMLGEVPEADAQGDLRVWPELKSVLMSESPSNRGYTRERKAGAREVAPQSAVMGKLAFMRPDDFRSRVQNSFYPWRHELEARCKRSFPYTLANIHTVEATEWGSVPGLVAGEHRPQGDRLCAVRVIWSSEYEADLPDPTKPFSYKHAGEDKTLPFVPRSLMAFPAGWLKRRWGFLGGLYGSPLDPTLLDWWGSNAPPENWLAALLEWLPPKQPYDDIAPYPRDVIEALITRPS